MKKEEIKKNIRKRIKEARTACGLTQRELAERIDRTEKYLSHIEVDRDVSLDTLIDIAIETNFPLEYFITIDKSSYDERIKALKDSDRVIIESLLDRFES